MVWNLFFHTCFISYLLRRFLISFLVIGNKLMEVVKGMRFTELIVADGCQSKLVDVS